MSEKLKKTKIAKVKTKTGGEYSYQYSDLAAVNEYLDKNNLAYDQYIGTYTEGSIFNSTQTTIDYIMTQKYTVKEDGTKEKLGEPMRGLRVDYSRQGEAIQDFGARLTYLRRYSVFMAFGLAPEDNDGQSVNKIASSPAPKVDASKTTTVGITSSQLWTLRKNINHPVVSSALSSYKKDNLEDLTVKEASTIIQRLKEEGV